MKMARWDLKRPTIKNGKSGDDNDKRGPRDNKRPNEIIHPTRRVRAIITVLEQQNNKKTNALNHKKDKGNSTQSGGHKGVYVQLCSPSLE